MRRQLRQKFIIPSTIMTMMNTATAVMSITTMTTMNTATAVMSIITTTMMKTVIAVMSIITMTMGNIAAAAMIIMPDEVFVSWGMETPAQYDAEQLQAMLNGLEQQQNYGVVLPGQRYGAGKGRQLDLF